MDNDKIVLDKVICSECKADNHKWHEVYYGECVTLKKIEKTYIAWCGNKNRYVLTSKND